MHNLDMKVVKGKNKKEQRSVTLRISEETMQKIDTVADKNDLSRQKLIESILEQVMEDKNFVLHLKEQT